MISVRIATGGSEGKEGLRGVSRRGKEGEEGDYGGCSKLHCFFLLLLLSCGSLWFAGPGRC